MSKKRLAILLSILYLSPICLLDIVTGSDLSLLVLYLLPVGACAYYAGMGSAMGISALHDPVTGLLNRRAFNSALLGSLEAAQGFCLALMEIEGLEDIYLDRGEAFVDALLKRMAGILRARAVGYRYSDQRFAFLMPALGRRRGGR